MFEDENKEITYKELTEIAHALVYNQSPASSEESHDRLVKSLVEYSIENNEPIERAWHLI